MRRIYASSTPRDMECFLLAQGRAIAVHIGPGKRYKDAIMALSDQSEAVGDSVMASSDRLLDGPQDPQFWRFNAYRNIIVGLDMFVSKMLLCILRDITGNPQKYTNDAAGFEACMKDVLSNLRTEMERVLSPNVVEHESTASDET